MDYQHTAISMEQLHQAMQSSLNPNNIIHNFQLPLSPRQMSTLMLKTNFSRNFAEIPAHLPRNLEMDLTQSLANELPQNLRHDEIIAQSLNRNVDISLVTSLRNELDLPNGIAQTLAQNICEDLRINDVSLQQLRSELPHDLTHEMDLSLHLNRQNMDQDLLEQRRMVIQCVPDSHLIDQNIQQRLDENIRLDGQQQIAQQSVVQRLDQNGQRVDQSVVQRLEQVGHRLEQRINGVSDRQMSQNDHVPMQFHIKSELEDDSYFYENINQGMTNIDIINGEFNVFAPFLLCNVFKCI